MRLTRIPLPILLLILQLPLILDPGWFSHDEIEWLARADVPSWSALPWIGWPDLAPLQYRPLTFNLWLALAHTWPTPAPMHLVFVLIGVTNAWLLARVLIRTGIADPFAHAAAVVFSLSPYAVYVHGWTGTLADLLTLASGLLAARCLQRALATTETKTAIPHALACALLVATALLCKESAIVLPALLFLVLPRDIALRRQALAIAPAVAVVLVYLLLRLPVLAASGETDPAYAWSLRNVPARLAEYLLYPFMPPLFEIAPLLTKSAIRIAAASACLVAFLATLATAGRRWPIVWLAAFAIALAPVLVLPISYNHYAYLASAVAIAIATSAWSHLHRIARNVLAVLAAIVMLHGVIVMARMYAVGGIQRNLYGDLLAELHASTAPLHIIPADPRDDWLPGRLLLGVDAYQGVSFGGRVNYGDTLSAHPGDRLLFMNRDGHLHPDGSPLTPH